MTKDSALKLALEAFEWNYNTDLDNIPACEQWAKMLKANITAIKEALANVPTSDTSQERVDKTAKNRHEQEPVVWMYQDKSTHEVRFQKHMRDFVDHSKTSEVPLYGEPLANHELQCVCGAVWCGDEMVHLPNKTPPQRTWQGLTDADILQIGNSCELKGKMTSKGIIIHPDGMKQFACAIEAKLKEKNT